MLVGLFWLVTVLAIVVALSTHNKKDSMSSAFLVIYPRTVPQNNNINNTWNRKHAGYLTFVGNFNIKMFGYEIIEF